MHSLLVGLGTIRIPIFVALLAIAIISLPGQSREIFFAIKEAKGWDLVVAGQAILLALAFAASLGLSTLRLLQTATMHRNPGIDDNRPVLEALVVALPLAALAGLVAALLESPSGPHRPIVIFGAALLAATTATYFLARNDGPRARAIAVGARGLSIISQLSLWHGIAITAALIAMVIAIVVGLPRPFALALGPLGVVFLFLGFLCVASSLLGYVYDRYQVPVISILVALAGLLAYMQSNDNHGIRLSTDSAEPAPPVDGQFRAWLLARPDLDDYRARKIPYPVYIVTAEGGGLYAAAHAAWRLAMIQDGCPAFARHVFAISSVSGGSLGAALFSALVKAQPLRPDLKPQEKCPPEPAGIVSMQLAVREFFREDMLTPLLAAGLFPDFFQRLWPLPVEEFDRARALEDSFDRAWRRALSSIAPHASADLGNTFTNSSRSLWSAKQDAPALMLNTTLVHSGERVIIAPFALRSSRPAELPVQFHGRKVDLLNSTASPRLTAAVGASARFPWVTPPARYVKLDSDMKVMADVQLVDGGYYENSGVFSALDLIGRLRSEPLSLAPQGSSDGQSETSGCNPNNTILVEGDGNGNVAACFRLITIRNVTAEQTGFVVGEALAPIATMFEARIAKAEANLLLANYLHCGGKNCALGRLAVNPHVYAAYINAAHLGVPLGWYLSNQSLEQIFSITAHNSKSTGIKPLTGQELARAEENNMLYSRIVADLKGH